jgi:peptidoglycan/xylan/chitin deacetylase (PgdA/CDA1 family)
MTLKAMLKDLVVGTGLPEAVLRHRARKYLTVLAYHRILPIPGEDYPFNEEVVSTTPEEFARELGYFRRHLDVISVPELIAGLDDPALLPPRPALITFDDGYWDNARIALPILGEHGLPACFFVCTGLVGTRVVPWYEQFVCCLKMARVDVIDSPFGGDDPPYHLDAGRKADSIRRFRRGLRRAPWSSVPRLIDRLKEETRVDPDEFVAEPLFMSWDDVRGLAAAGMEVGGHTRSHPLLSRVEDRATLHDEISGSFGDLARALGRGPRAFAYPVGSNEAMSARADDEIRRAGYVVSFSYTKNFSPRVPADRFRIPRIACEYLDDYRSFRLGMALAHGVR